MTFELPSLPFKENELEPWISAETLRYHYGKHHRAYCDKLNDLIKGTQYEELPLEEIIRTSSGPIFNNAAQFWNHNFYWQCLTHENAGKMSADLENALKSSFTSVEGFKKAFAKAGMDQFGSGWAWLVRNDDGRLSIEKTSNAENPIQKGTRLLHRLPKRPS
jgi:Fe-Mn family superoxide dismutase